MRLWAILLSSGVAVTSTGAALAQTAPTNYVGVGIRAGLNDDTAAVINSKVQVTELGDFTVSVRPALYIGSDVEGRLPITLETSLDSYLFPYVGGGLAYNTDGLSTVDPMVTAGLDVGLGGSWVVDVKLNVIFQPGDTDTELVGAVNYRF
jgi:hypothetical protein